MEAIMEETESEEFEVVSNSDPNEGKEKSLVDFVKEEDRMGSNSVIQNLKLFQDTYNKLKDSGSKIEDVINVIFNKILAWK